MNLYFQDLEKMQEKKKGVRFLRSWEPSSWLVWLPQKIILKNVCISHKPQTQIKNSVVPQ